MLVKSCLCEKSYKCSMKMEYWIRCDACLVISGFALRRRSSCL